MGLVVICLASLSSQAQSPPSVPSQMEFAGIKLKITAGAKREIEETIDLLTRNQYYFQLKVDRSNLYMHFVEKVLKDEGIPDDFKFLAIQEGEFISDAVSTSNAVGFWQFKKASAQELGLRVDNVVDERKHIISSTIGATKYLKRSNFVFDNWVLSLQSYLQGLGGTQRSVSESFYGSKKFEVNKKTHWYIKKFIAHKLAFEGVVGQGRKHPDVELAYFMAKGKGLRKVSEELGADFAELTRFNKWLGQNKIPSEKDYYVIYPVKSGQRIVDISTKKSTGNKKLKSESTTSADTRKASGLINEAEDSDRIERASKKRATLIRPVSGNVGAYPLITGNRQNEFELNQIKLNGIPAIRAGEGESFNDLARKTNLSVLKIKVFNDIGVESEVKAGNYYYLKNKRSKGKVHYHVVQPNEELWGIAQDYGIKLKKLLSKNRMHKLEELKVGRVLWLRFIRPQKVPIEYNNVLIPAPGIIAENRLIREFDSPLENLESELVEEPQKEIDKPLKSESMVPIEKKMLIASEQDTILTHRVLPKESLFRISKKYNVAIDDILDWNGLNIMDGLKIDQRLNLVVVKEWLIKSEVKVSETIIHEVIKGDTVWSISKKYDVTVEEILKWNSKSDDALALGEKLKIFKDK